MKDKLTSEELNEQTQWVLQNITLAKLKEIFVDEYENASLVPEHKWGIVRGHLGAAISEKKFNRDNWEENAVVTSGETVQGWIKAALRERENKNVAKIANKDTSLIEKNLERGGRGIRNYGGYDKSSRGR